MTNEQQQRIDNAISTLEVLGDREYTVVKTDKGTYVLESEQRRVLITDNVQWVISTLEEIVSILY